MHDDKPSNPLKEKMVAMIRDRGPIDLADYMRIALTDPEHGYYMASPALGAEGDFTTAPEISQMFGELIGLWIVDTWMQMRQPQDTVLVELGPGRGTLMADAQRAIEAASDMPINLHLVEASPGLKAEQATRLDATWCASLDDVPAGPMILIANEFFDALPIHQRIKTRDGWFTIVVDADANNNLVPTLGALADEPAYADHETPEGALYEIPAAGIALAEQIAARLTSQRGAALIIDYGPENSAVGNSLQAVQRHDYTDPFADPGRADLTAHVDFEALGTAARAKGATVLGPVTQNHFLNQLGLAQRAAVLKQGATPGQRREVDLAAHRLTAPDQMGTLFKALAIADPTLTALAGFAP